VLSTRYAFNEEADNQNKVDGKANIFYQKAVMNIISCFSNWNCNVDSE